MNSPRLVILGNGGAAINAAMAIRSAGHEGEVCMVSDRSEPAFNPMLSPYYLKGKISWNHCFPFGKDFYQKYAITCRFGSLVESLDGISRRIYLADGKEITFDRCLIATGASPVIPSIPGLRESTRAHPLRTSHDTKIMEKAISRAREVIILGASLVGTKLAEILSKKGIKVILLDIAPRLLPQGLHPDSAALLEKYFHQNGIETRLGCTLEGLEETPQGVVCPLPEGVHQEASFVAVSVGVKPNLLFLDPSQVDIQDAILVDDRMQTSVEGLYAAGDVCQGMNIQSGRKEWLGTWANACYQGRTAGFNMAGKYTTYSGSIPQNVSPFFDWIYTQIGNVHSNGGDTCIISEGDPFKGPYRLLAFKRDILIGANLINCPDSGMIRNAIIKKMDREMFFKTHSYSALSG